MPEKAATWGKRPSPVKTTSLEVVDSFVNGATGKMARLNFVIPGDLHRRVKAACAQQGVSMTDVVVEFLESRFPRR